MNRFYQENKQERSRPLPKDIMKNIKILEKMQEQRDEKFENLVQSRIEQKQVLDDALFFKTQQDHQKLLQDTHDHNKKAHMTQV